MLSQSVGLGLPLVSTVIGTFVPLSTFDVFIACIDVFYESVNLVTSHLHPQKFKMSALNNMWAQTDRQTNGETADSASEYNKSGGVEETLIVCVIAPKLVALSNCLSCSAGSLLSPHFRLFVKYCPKRFGGAGVN